jgi:hypothetical protein
MAKPKCEDRMTLDLASFRLRNLLFSGSAGLLIWRRGGRRGATIGYAISDTEMRLIYRRLAPDGRWQNRSELIEFTTSATRFSGRRLWFKCPGCSQRCRVVFSGAQFACRRCHDLRFRSQYECRWQRLIDQADAVRRRVGGGPGAFERAPFPSRPRGLHFKTYRLLEMRYEVLVEKARLMERARFRSSDRKRRSEFPFLRGP